MSSTLHTLRVDYSNSRKNEVWWALKSQHVLQIVHESTQHRRWSRQLFEQALAKITWKTFVSSAYNVFPNSGSPSLAAKQQFEFECRLNILALSITKNIQSQGARRRELYKRRRQLTVDRLKQCRTIQPRKLTSRTLTRLAWRLTAGPSLLTFGACCRSTIL